ncbi:MAG: phytanoyl-CoA dioxygenase family protein [Phycisphaeraceae bacterium]
MFTDQQVEAYRRDGFALGSRVLDDAQIQALRDELERVIAEKDEPDGPKPVLLRNLGQEDTPVWQIVDIWMASEPFRDLLFNETLVQEAAQLSGARQLRVWHDQIQYKPHTTGGVNMWHQDSPAWPPVMPKDQQVTAWVALDDVDEDNGCMSMVPGSHEWGVAPAELRQIEDYDKLPDTCQGHKIERSLRPVKAGHVHYHHPLTWHGSHHNRSGRPRRAIAVHYMTEKTVFTAGERAHPKSPWIHVKAGETIVGDGFPLVYDGAPLAAPTA